MLKQEVRRVYLSPFFYLGIIVLVICSLLAVSEDIRNNPDIIYLLDEGAYGYNKMLIPILAGLAVADSYLIEIKNGYHYAVMSRTRRLKYCLSKIAVAIMTGMVTVLLSKLLFLLVVTIIVKILHGEIVVGDRIVESFDGIVGLKGSGNFATPYWIRRQNFLLYIGQIILYDGLYASIFPAMAFVASVFCSNKYIVLLTSYIYNEVMSLVFVGFKLYYVSPTVLYSGGRANLLMHEGLPFRIIVVLMYWVLEALIFIYGVNRQTRE